MVNKPGWPPVHSLKAHLDRELWTSRPIGQLGLVSTCNKTHSFRFTLKNALLHHTYIKRQQYNTRLLPPRRVQ